jgi:hypothetical protein
MQSFLETDFPELLDLLYESALVPERWPAFFERMSKTFADAKGVLQLYDRRVDATTANINCGTAPEYLDAFALALCVEEIAA